MAIPNYAGEGTTVQQVITAAQRDFTNLIGANHDALIDYTNRVHLDLLRHSRWRWLRSEPVQFTTEAGQTDYYLGTDDVPEGAVDSGLQLDDLDIILEGTVVNRTSNRILGKFSSKPLGSEFDQQRCPLTYWLHNDGVLSLYPIPDKAYTIEFAYQKKRQLLTVPEDTLQVPDQYFDVVVAGVNELLAKYLAKDNPQYQTDVPYWHGVYQMGKTSIIKDANLFPRVDFIRGGY